MVAAFKTIFESTNHRLSRLKTDNGKEFIYRRLKQYFEELIIKPFTTNNEKSKLCGTKYQDDNKPTFLVFLTNKQAKRGSSVEEDVC